MERKKYGNKQMETQQTNSLLSLALPSSVAHESQNILTTAAHIYLIAALAKTSI